MTPLRAKENAKWLRKKMLEHMSKHGTEPVLVSLPIQYKPQWVEKEVGVPIVSAPVFDDGTRTYICTEEEWLLFDKQFPTVAKRLNNFDALETFVELCK
jgi:hypothetical protein